MGRWSASGGLMFGYTSQITTGSVLLSLCHTLSGHVQFDIIVSYVGMP